MKKTKANLLLLLTSAIWGFAFVAQQVGMDHIGPFTFTAVRFALGSASLIPLILYFKKTEKPAPAATANTTYVGLAAGCILFCGASLQQVGLLYTTAGKAAFTQTHAVLLTTSAVVIAALAVIVFFTLAGHRAVSHAHH